MVGFIGLLLVRVLLEVRGGVGVLRVVVFRVEAVVERYNDDDIVLVDLVVVGRHEEKLGTDDFFLVLVDFVAGFLIGDSVRVAVNDDMSGVALVREGVDSFLEGVVKE